MRGRPTKPTALKLVTGNPGKRALNKKEPKPEDANLAAPRWLIPEAAAVWNEIAPTLGSTGLLTKVDVQMLAMGCVAIAQFRIAAKETASELVASKIVENKDGDPIEIGLHVNPWLVAQSMSFKQAMAVFTQFGMSPAARSRLVVEKSEDGKSKAASYFN